MRKRTTPGTKSCDEGHEDSEDDEDDEDEEEEDDDSGDDDSDEDEEEEEDDEVDVLETPSAEERKAIEKDPGLRKIHKLMQADYTRKTTEISERERATEQRQARLDAFEKAVQTPAGMKEFLTRNLHDHMDIVGAAFESVATGPGGLDFLVEVGLHNPEVFRKAADKVDLLESDEDEKARHIRDRDGKADDLRRKRDRLKLAQEKFDTQSGKLMTAALRTAKALKIHKDDLGEVQQAVIQEIDGHVQKDGTIDLTPAAVKRAVKKVKHTIDKRIQRAEERLTRRKAAGRRDDVKKKAASAKKKRVVPRRGSTGSRGVGSKREAARAARGKVPEGVDPLDHYLEKRMRGVRL